MKNATVDPSRLALSNAAGLVFILTAYALPLIILPSLVADAVEMPKLAVLTLSTAALMGIGLARFFLYRQSLCPNNSALLPLACLLGWALFSIAVSPAPVVTARAWLYLGALATAAFMIGSLADPDGFLNALLISGGLVALYGLAQFMNFDPFPWESHFRPRIFSSMGNPVFLGGFLAALFPVAFARWLYTEREETKDLLTLLLAVLGIAVYLTWTRSSWLALASATAVQMGILTLRAAGRRLLAENRAWLFTAGIVGLVALTLVTSTKIFGNEPVPLLDRIRDAFNFKAYSVRFRLVTAESALRITAAHPIAGGGLASFRSLYPHVRLETRAARTAENPFFASQEAYTHNDHAQILAELGVIGLGLWIWFLFCAVRTAVQRFGDGRDWLSLAVLGAIVAVCVDGSLNFPLQIAPTAWIFFCLIGLLGRPSRVPPPPPKEKWRALAAGVFIALSLLIALRPIAAEFRTQYNLMLGDRQVGSNNYEMASVYYTRASAECSHNKFAAFRASVALMHAARYEWYGHTLDQSFRLGERAKELGYEDENVYKHLGDLFGRKTAYLKAVRALTQANALNPEREDIANNLAYYLAESGTRLAEAIRLAKMAVEKGGERATFLDTLGWAQYRSGRFREAEISLKRALRAIPASMDTADAEFARAEIKAHLAQVRRAMGR